MEEGAAEEFGVESADAVTEIAFYHLTKWPLEHALPRLLEKAYASGQRSIVMAGSAERAEALNALLWTDGGRGGRNDGFLPHGSEADGYPSDQPIWLTHKEENPNQAAFLFLCDGATSTGVAGFERCFELFDAHDPAAVAAARERWRAYKDAGHRLTYWQQTERGGWEKKADA